MNRIILSIFTVALLLTGSTVTAQTFEVPQNPRLEQESDYARYAKDVIACVNWLEATPVDKETDKRKEADHFLMQWIQGSPDVTISIREYVGKMAQADPALLVAFMGGWTRYVLAKKDTAELAGNLAGSQCALKVYENSKSIPRNADMDALTKLAKEGKLKAWIAVQLKK